MLNLYDFTPDELASHLVEAGFKKFNSVQIFEWVYQKKVTDFALMSNLKNDLRSYLAESFAFQPLTIAKKQIAADGTVKYLHILEDGHRIETVLMHQDYGDSVCVTSQVGCNMGCAFCASGLKKRTRNLTAAELVAQIVSVETDQSIRVSHIVVMGTGEPFDNYDNVVKFLHIVNEAKGLAIGQRHITVSTCGIVPKILQFADEPIRPNLAISLHAPNDELRSQLMPINKAYPLKEVIAACETYFAKTSRRITFEYILLAGVNDSIQHADQLSDLIRGLNAYVNLIPYNVVKEFGFERTDMKRAMQFYDRLEKRGINAVLRKEQGGDIDAACGQLRLKSE